LTETFKLLFPASETVARRAHVGVVGSGDLEILLEPSSGDTAFVSVTTHLSGHRKTWEALLGRFFERHAFAMQLEIRDHGATPGTVWLRLEQALELAQKGERG
jgi:malonate decarboxylase delta subunit